MRITYRTNGHSGTGQALIQLRSIFQFNLSVCVPYSLIMDYGNYIPTFGHTVRVIDAKSRLRSSDTQFIIYHSELPERLEKIQKRARTLRKSVWLFDMSIQPADEMVSLFDRSYYKQGWNNYVTINGPTLAEDINSYDQSYNYLTSFFRSLSNANEQNHDF